jgi:hypothetical protein
MLVVFFFVFGAQEGQLSGGMERNPLSDQVEVGAVLLLDRREMGPDLV